MLESADIYFTLMINLSNNEIVPRKTAIENAKNEITRIVSEVTASHIESHGANEQPHEHSGP